MVAILIYMHMRSFLDALPDGAPSSVQNSSSKVGAGVEASAQCCMHFWLQFALAVVVGYRYSELIMIALMIMSQ